MSDGQEHSRCWAGRCRMSGRGWLLKRIEELRQGRSMGGAGGDCTASAQRLSGRVVSDPNEPSAFGNLSTRVRVGTLPRSPQQNPPAQPVSERQVVTTFSGMAHPRVNLKFQGFWSRRLFRTPGWRASGGPARLQAGPPRGTGPQARPPQTPGARRQRPHPAGCAQRWPPSSPRPPDSWGMQSEGRFTGARVYCSGFRKGWSG